MNILEKAIAIGTLSLSLTTFGCSSTPPHECGDSYSSSYASNHDCKEHPHVYCLQQRFRPKENKPLSELTDPNEIRAEIARAKDDDLNCVAGALEERIGLRDQAITDYVRAKKYESAANLLELKGEKERAHVLYEQAFDQYFKIDKCYKCSVKIAERLGDKPKLLAAKTELLNFKDKEGDYYGATDLAEELGALETAITESEKGGYDERAAELCIKHGDKKRALKNYEASGMYKKERACLSLDLASEADHLGDPYLALDYYKKAADAGDKSSNGIVASRAQALHRYDIAIEYYKRNGSWESKREEVMSEAQRYVGRLFEQGEFDEAVKLAELIDDPHLAAYRKCAVQFKLFRKEHSKD